MRRIPASLALGSALASGGCFLALGFDYDTSDVETPEAGRPDVVATDGATGNAVMTVAPAEITLFPETSNASGATVEVKLERREGFSRAVRLSATGLPAGVTTNASTVVISPTATSASVTFDAAKGAKHTKATITLRGEADGQTFESTLRLVVRGTPGSVDTSFGTNGVTHVSFGEPASLIQMQVLGDDRVLLAGGVEGKEPSFAVARLTAEGVPDTSLAGKGLVVTGATGGGATAIGLVSGGFVAAGAAAGKLTVVRYRDDGSLDPTWSGGAPLTVGVGLNVVNVFEKPGGGLAMAGHDGFRTSILHLRKDGSVDGSLGDGGVVQPPGGLAGAAAIGADGTILVAGPTGNGGCAITSFPGFGASASAPVEEVGNCIGIDDLAIGDGGTRGATGHTINITSFDFMIGYKRAPSQPAKAAVQLVRGNGLGVALDATNRLLVTGAPSSTDGRTFYVARLGLDDALDPSFQVGTAPIGSAMVARRVGVQRDGRIVVAGTSESLGKSKVFSVVRYWP
ncbi:MAG: hypothetical protein JST00_05145 [Deltaproteobacteria bacterium]|nr:hypothetical protein [Deltaproteobacteria bacterium]